MLKALLAATLFAVLLDLGVDHGEYVKRFGASMAGFTHWASDVGKDSLFTH